MTKARRKFNLIFLLQGIWLLLVCLLTGWWGWLLVQQAHRINELEKITGQDSGATLLSNTRMLVWEGSAFFLILLLFSGFLIYLYWRDLRRTRSIQSFFASVTHELRTPLTSIRLQAESISDQNPGTDDTLTKRLLQDTTRLETYIDRILELARVELGGRLFAEPVELHSWLQHESRFWKSTHSEKVDLDLRVDEGTILADRTALQVIFRNLVENSVRHSEKRPVRIKINTKKEGDHLHVIFRDQGSGSQENPEELGTLFKKHSRSRGAGIGLYLIRTLMKRMDGDVQFANDEGFRVQLSFFSGDAHASG